MPFTNRIKGRKYPQEGFRSILVRGTNWIGDCVCSLPALRVIRRTFPSAELTLMVKPWVAGIYQPSKLIDHLLIYDRSGEYRGAKGFLSVVRQLRKGGYELAILFQNAFQAAALTFFARIPHRWGYATDGRGFLLTRALPVNKETLRRHHVYYYTELLRGLGIAEEEPPQMELLIDEGAKEKMKQLLLNSGVSWERPLVGINPGAAFGPAKRWLPERFGEVADRLEQSADCRVVVVGSTRERDIARKMTSFMKSTPIVLTGKTTLQELIAVISLCQLFISNDSGPMHLAAALRVPTIGIFGPTDERITAPWGEGHSVISKQLDCRPCQLADCPTEHRCMKAITAEEVYSVARQKLTETERLKSADKGADL
ncbi:lipopolysaccharide heptosyltransferase II [bacterium (candidate division B38) B3_B38]|nr:MAG: lipopolysaccharide heptosyltransferase II [bacterium (candidate division B38) B3_B38]